MKFLVDAQLPVRLAIFLRSQGYDTLHTSDLAFKNSTSDGEINIISLREERVVITKDSDFFDSFMLRREPFKLLLITTGNINNLDLEILFAKNIGQLIELFQSYSLIESRFFGCSSISSQLSYLQINPCSSIAFG